MGDVVNIRPAAAGGESPERLNRATDMAFDVLAQVDPTLAGMDRPAIGAARVADLMWHVSQHPEHALLMWAILDLAVSRNLARSLGTSANAWAAVHDGLESFIAYATEAGLDARKITAALDGHPSTQEEPQP